MLTPQELQKGMAFPDEYKILGGKKNQVRQLGNALTPPVMAMILGRCAEALR
jgi:DNA (cytosine-5)-methyltransferase 1